jgi:hypothetical protein
MKLREKQSRFLIDIANLIIYAKTENIELTGGELYRTIEQQQIYVKQGKSKTLKSKHLQRLAIDLNVFINGEYKEDKESHKKLAKYWEEIRPENKSGYSWGWDANHYQTE